MANRLFSVAVLALATGALLSMRRQSQRRRAGVPARPKPVPVQTWEGEGGALPATGSHMGPDPAVATTTDESTRSAEPTRS
jgi:hypothetical protein